MGNGCYSSKKSGVNLFYLKESQEFFQNYSLAHTVGKGSSGEVKLAYDNFTNKKVAVKIVDKAEVIKNKSYSNVIQQKKILQLLSQNSSIPFITHLIKCSQDHKNLYFILQYFANGTLRKLIKNKNSLNIHQLKFFSICLLIALNFLHQNRVLHGDLKPENILIDENGYFVIGDFSSAKFYGCKSIEIKGTQGYMAPELTSSEICILHNNLSDMYSFGSILRQMSKGSMYYRSKQRKLSEDVDLTGDQSSGSSESNDLKIADPLFEDFLQSLLKSNSVQRMNIEEALRHPWINLQKNERDLFIKKKASPHPFEPISEFFDYNKRKNMNRNLKESDAQNDQLLSSVLLSQRKFQDMFQSFTLDKNSRKKQEIRTRKQNA